MGIEIKPIPPPLQFDAHGVCRVAGARLTLLTLIDAFQEGATPEEIHQEYPSVSLADENLKRKIISGLLRRNPLVDVVRAQDVG